MAILGTKYQSVKDSLPAADGKFYDVMVILYGVSISGGYNYHKGLYNDGTFFVDSGNYNIKNDFICSWTQKKVIAWKPLETVSKEQLNEFFIKAGVK